jgi:hypothetical protein
MQTGDRHCQKFFSLLLIEQFLYQSRNLFLQHILFGDIYHQVEGLRSGYLPAGPGEETGRGRKPSSSLAPRNAKLTG